MQTPHSAAGFLAHETKHWIDGRVKNIHTAYVETGELFSWGNAKEFITLGLSVAGMGLAGSSIAKSGKSLKAMWQGESAVQPAAVSNATKKVAGGSGSSSGLRYDLQMFAGKSGSGTRVFTSKDPLVGSVATQIEQKLLGRVASVNKVVYRSDGSILTDLDIELDSIVIQVKTGGGKS